MSNLIAKYSRRQHCNKPMDTWTNTRWDNTKKELVPVRYWVCVQCSHQEIVKR